MAADIDDDELLHGLAGQARRERAELIQWLRAHDFDDQQIRARSYRCCCQRIAW